MRRLTLDIYSHYFKIRGFNARTKPIIMAYVGRYVELKMAPNPNKNSKRKYIPQPVKLYAGTNKHKTEFRLHINLLDDFKLHLNANGINSTDIDIVKHDVPVGDTVIFNDVDKRQPYDEQIPIIEYLKKDQPIKAVTSQTGKGKTYMALTAIRHIGKRVLLTLTKDTYISKWLEDVVEAFGLRPGEVYKVQGKDALAGIIELAKTKQLDDVKFIIVSSKTLGMFIDAYEGEKCNVIEEYGCLPEDLFEVLGVGVKLIDESHEQVHNTYRQFMYTNVEQSISLSATLINDSRFLTDIIETMYPQNIRPKPTPYDRYIDVYDCIYHLSNDHRRCIRYKQRGMGSYSHVTLEKSIMSRDAVFYNYMAILDEIIHKLYFDKRDSKHKLLIFASTIDMCNAIVTTLSAKYPDEVIAKYTGEDSYDTLDKSTILVSTLGSAGTGVDITDLLTAICTVAVGSSIQNIQALGRLRRLRRTPDVTPIFAFMSCVEIPNHVEYNRKKLRLFADKTKNMYNLTINTEL